MLLLRLQPVLLCIGIVLFTGCRWAGTLKTLTPSQLISSEISQKGMAALERNDAEEAEKWLSEAVRFNKNDVAHRRNYAEVLWKQGKHNEALKQLDEALKRGGDDASIYVSLAEKNLFLGQPSVAFHHANLAVRLNPNDSQCWALRGKAGLQLAQQQQHTWEASRFAEVKEQVKIEEYLLVLSL